MDSSEMVSVQGLCMTFCIKFLYHLCWKRNTRSIVSLNNSNGVLVLINTYRDAEKGSR